MFSLRQQEQHTRLASRATPEPLAARQPASGRTSWPTRSTGAAYENLSDDDKTIKAVDMLYQDDDGNRGDDAGVGGWYDWMSPAFLQQGGGSMQHVAAFCALTPGCFRKGADGGRGGACLNPGTGQAKPVPG